MKKDPPLLTLPAAKRICMQESIKQYEQFVSHNPAVNAVFNHPTLKETMQPYLGYNGLLALRSSHRYFKDFPWRVGLITGSEYTQSKILATLLQQPIPNADNAARLLEIILPYKKSLKRKIFHTDEFISDSREMFNLPIADRRLMFNITLAYLLIIRLKKVIGDVVGVALYKKKLNHYYRGDKLAKKILSELNESQLLEVESEIFQFVHLMCVNNPNSDELVGNDDLTTLQVVFAHEYASYYKFESPRTLFKKHQQKVNIFKLLILHPNFNKEPLVLRFLELMNSSETHEYGKPVIAYYISEIIKYCCNDVLLQKYLGCLLETVLILKFLLLLRQY